MVRPLANVLSNIVFYKVMLFGQPFPMIVLWLAIALIVFTLYLGCHTRPQGVATPGRHNDRREHRPHGWMLAEAHIKVPGFNLGGIVRRAFQNGNFRKTVDRSVSRVSLQGAKIQREGLRFRRDVLVSG